MTNDDGESAGFTSRSVGENCCRQREWSSWRKRRPPVQQRKRQTCLPWAVVGSSVNILNSPGFPPQEYKVFGTICNGNGGVTFFSLSPESVACYLSGKLQKTKERKITKKKWRLLFCQPHLNNWNLNSEQSFLEFRMLVIGFGAECPSDSKKPGPTVKVQSPRLLTKYLSSIFASH